jgi:hypothetical protein
MDEWYKLLQIVGQHMVKSPEKERYHIIYIMLFIFLIVLSTANVVIEALYDMS